MLLKVVLIFNIKFYLFVSDYLIYVKNISFSYLLFLFLLGNDSLPYNVDIFSNLRRCRGSSSIMQCPYCSYSTTAKGRLRDHILTHTGERPHPCPHCGRRFAQKSTMRRHAKGKHCV